MLLHYVFLPGNNTLTEEGKAMKTKKELQTALIKARGRAYEAWAKAQGYRPGTEPQQLAHIADMAVHKMERELALFDA